MESPKNLTIAAIPFLGFCALIACDDTKPVPPSAPQARSQGVMATTPPAPTPQAVQSAAPAADAPHPILCARQLAKPTKNTPKANVSRAGQTSMLSEKLPVGAGHWTWINLWAAWCGPCKEEIPRLKSWEAKTASERVPLKVAFISIDDDARQLETFLGAQPAEGLHATYWLKDGGERQAWLKEAAMDTEPELPAHILVDPEGDVRCKQQGAIDDQDFPEVLKILRGERTAASGG
jgi:thiol-disulfide isomerase/thioredoxin